MDAGNYVYPPWTMGVIYTGWAALGEFDPHVQAVVDDVFVALRKGPPFNPSLGAMNTVWGKLEIAAHAAKNLARNRQLP
jgi:hypothetical protein